MAISIGQYAPVFLLGGFCGGSEVKASPCNAGDLALIPGLGRSSGEGKCYPLQYSDLENSMDYSPWGHKELDTTERLSLPPFLGFLSALPACEIQSRGCMFSFLRGVLCVYSSS